MTSDHKKNTACSEHTQIVRTHDLPLSCPMDHMSLWDAHPKVYLPIEETGTCVCPYCSTVFVLEND